MPVSRRHLSLLGCLLGAWLVAVPAWPQVLDSPPASGPNPQDLVKLGIQQAVKGNLDGALADFNQALKIDPRWAPALEKKGLVLLRQNKLDDAFKNFDQAVQIDPTYEDAMYYRGVVNGGLAHFDAACLDFSRVIALNAGYAPAYAGRGKARFFKSDFAGAVADTTQALQLDGRETDCYYYRGLAERASGNATAAAADFQFSSDTNLAYGAYWNWIVTMEAGKKDMAQKNLSDFLDQRQSTQEDWAKSIGDFLVQRTGRDDFLSRAMEADPSLAEPCEAWFFIGVSKRLAGDVAGAQDAFRRSIATGSTASVEYAEAQLELAKLSKP